MIALFFAMTNERDRQINVLFLLRSYNDIDHIVPIIWKCRESDLHCYYFFTEADSSNDYRIKFIEENGAVKLRSWALEFYHVQIRKRFILDIIKKVVDVIVGWIIGQRILRKKNIDVVVTEWSGKLGRGKAQYLLRPAFRMKLAIYSVPHGYNIYTNLDVSRTIINHKRSTGGWLDFSSRNSFSRYVVQHEATRRFCVAYGIEKKNISVLGSARFCREWVDINNKLLQFDLGKGYKQAPCKVVFFLPQWEYNVDRKECYQLILLLSRLSDVFIRLKGTTREISGLYESEERKFQGVTNIDFSSREASAALIRWADVVVNFASSIGIEAVMQGKVICNPKYLHSNRTIFDDSGIAVDCADHDSVQNVIVKFINGLIPSAHVEDLKKFYTTYIQGNNTDSDVLGKYVSLIKDGF